MQPPNGPSGGAAPRGPTGPPHNGSQEQHGGYDPQSELRRSLSDRYRVEEEIGRGGMATVYRAEDLRHGRTVALKVLSPELSATLGTERFLREVHIATRLSHPHILPVYDSGDAGGLLWYAMPFVAGESLRVRLDRDRQLPVDEAVSIICEVADALAFAHSQGVVHRDVKPENVLMHGGHAVLADFGIARPTDSSDTRLTGTGISIGTAAYMSPEQASGEAVDARADIYSLGALLYEVLVGQVPFTGANAAAVMARAALEPPPSIHVVRPGVPEEIEDAVMRALDKVPADRFQTMAEFKSALLDGAATPYASRTMRHTAMRRVERRRKTRKRLAIVGAAAVCLLAAGAAAAKGLHWFGPARPAPDASLRRVAVLYFADGSRDRSLRALADGLTENLNERLSQVGALDVISRNGVLPFRDRDVPLDSIGRALHAGLLVTGDVQSGDRGMDVHVSLVDGATGEKLRSGKFHHDSADMIRIQSEIADRVATFLREQVGDEVHLRAERGATTSQAAWLLVLRASKRRKDADSLLGALAVDASNLALHEADSMLARAQGLDPKWVAPSVQRASLALARVALLRNQPARLAPVVDSGLAFADHALVLAPNDPDALEVRGSLLWEEYNQHLIVEPNAAARTLARAESSLKAAVELNKNQAGAWAALGALYYRRPDLQLAMDAARNAYAADAFLGSARVILSQLFQTSYNLELFPEARRWCDLGRERFPNDPSFAKCRLVLYTSRAERADPDSVWKWWKRYLDLTPATRRPIVELEGRLYAAGGLVRAGLADSARHVITDVLRRATSEIDPQKDLAAISAAMYVMLGDQDKAVDELKDYLTVNPEHRKGFATRVGWWWRDLQGNARFKMLIAGAR
ncbi:MAG TPA: protein kinase [Gemmatimonadaceae bacterium]|nr:protein kinase [Gemmatimonadaceae bacterium]